MLFEHQVHILTLHWKFTDLLGFLGNIDEDKQPSLIQQHFCLCHPTKTRNNKKGGDPNCCLYISYTWVLISLHAEFQPQKLPRIGKFMAGFLSLSLT